MNNAKLKSEVDLMDYRQTNPLNDDSSEPSHFDTKEAFSPCLVDLKPEDLN